MKKVGKMRKKIAVEHIRTQWVLVLYEFALEYSELSIKRTGCNKRTGGKILSK